MIHYHSCPECYEKHKCNLNCTIEPDLEDNGKQYGSHCACDDCQYKIDCLKNKEFWDKYNGFTK